jgi:molybdopterin molybdotransferase
VSVAVSFEVFVRPALLRLQGRAVIDRRRARLTASETWTTPPGRRQYLPAVVDLVAGTVRPATPGGSGSHLAASLARAEAFAIVPAEVASVAVGDPVDVMLIP